MEFLMLIAASIGWAAICAFTVYFYESSSLLPGRNQTKSSFA